MQITDVLLLVVEREGKDGLHGRTLLQKKLYFLSVLRKANFGFSAHYYGPYSGFVAEHLNGLVEDGIFKEVTEFFTTDLTERNALGEKRRHTYFLTDEGRRIWQITQKKDDFPKWDRALKKINNQEIADNFNLLSIAARRLESGRDTTCAVAVSGNVSPINKKKVKQRNCFFINLAP